MAQIWDKASKFFVDLFFAFVAIGQNLAGNSVPFANDLTALFPRYMDIQRGQYVCAVIAFSICPWKIEASATRFPSFINGYSVFLGSVAGVLLTDFFIVRRAKHFNVYHLYKPHGIYWYKDGVNLRAMAAFTIGMVPQLPGLAYQINPQVGALYIHYRVVDN